MKHDVILAGHSCHSLQNRRSLLVMARITADKQHIHRPGLVKCEWRHLWIVCGKEIFCPVAHLLQPRQSRRKIADDEIVTGKGHVLERQRMPAYDAFDATGKAPDEIARPARHVQIVKDVSTVLLDLRPEDI